MCFCLSSPASANTFCNAVFLVTKACSAKGPDPLCSSVRSAKLVSSYPEASSTPARPLALQIPFTFFPCQVSSTMCASSSSPSSLGSQCSRSTNSLLGYELPLGTLEFDASLGLTVQSGVGLLHCFPVHSPSGILISLLNPFFHRVYEAGMLAVVIDDLFVVRTIRWILVVQTQRSEGAEANHAQFPFWDFDLLVRPRVAHFTVLVPGPAASILVIFLSSHQGRRVSAFGIAKAMPYSG